MSNNPELTPEEIDDLLNERDYLARQHDALIAETFKGDE